MMSTIFRLIYFYLRPRPRHHHAPGPGDEALLGLRLDQVPRLLLARYHLGEER